MPVRIGLGVGLFIGSIALGWWLHRRGRLNAARATRLVWLVMTGPSPVVLCLLFWQMNLRSAELWLLPFLGLLISSSTLLPAILYARYARLSRPQKGSFLNCAFFSNLGYFGAFTAYAVFGETAYGLCILYLVFFIPSFYSLGFWIAARYGGTVKPSGTRTMSNDRLQFYPFAGMLAGVLLNLAGIPRPAPLELVNQVLIPAYTVLYLVAIGSQLTLVWPRQWLRACLVMSGIKFVYTPLIAWGLVHLFHLDGLPRIVVLLEAATPMAVSPLVLPLLFGVDRQLANALWLFTTILAVPWFLIYLPLIR